MATLNDIVLIHLEDTPISFARIESILPDHKKDWYQIKLLMLQMPLQSVTWILKEDYINGDDFFMNGKKMRLELVKCPPDKFETPVPEEKTSVKKENQEESGKTDQKGKIISFADFKGKSNTDIG